MSKTVLIIDNNPAVQALAADALKPLELEVIAIDDGENIFTKLRNINPAVILLSEDVPKLDPYEFLLRASHDKSLSPLGLVLLTTGDDKAKKDSLAKKAGAQATINKPFRSSQLRSLVEDLLRSGETRNFSAEPVSLILPPGVWRQTFERLLEKRSVPTFATDSLLAALAKAREHKFQGCIFSASLLSEITKYDKKKLGELIILATSEEELRQLSDLPDYARIIAPPLSYEKINKAFLAAFPKCEEPPLNLGPLNPNQEIELTRKLTTTLLEELLGSEQLKTRRYMELSERLQAKVLNACQDFEKDKG